MNAEKGTPKRVTYNAVRFTPNPRIARTVPNSFISTPCLTSIVRPSLELDYDISLVANEC